MPDLKAGEVFRPYRETVTGEWGYQSCTEVRNGFERFFFKETVENNPDWFAPLDERWKPKHGDRYYYVDSDNQVEQTNFVGYSLVDKNSYESGNCFRTREEAEAAASRVKELLLSLHKDN